MNMRGLVLLCHLLLFAANLPAQDRRGPFVHEPRTVRTRDVDQQHVRLDLKFDLERQEFKGRATHRMSPFRALRSLTLDAAQMTISRVTIVSGSPSVTPIELKFETSDNSLKVALDREYAANESFELAIEYQVVQPRHGAHFVVPDADEPSQPRMVWTQSEPEYARFWYPCIDAPADRITSETVVTSDSRYFVLSNGSLKGKVDNGDGTHTWHWAQEQTHVPYLVSVVVGEFDALEQSWDGIPVVSYVPRGRLADAARSFEKTPLMMKYFSEQIGFRYPWPKYAQICVDEYEWGGMEHTSATTLNLETLHDERAHLDVESVGLVAHELAHQWWGDLVTCKDWGELWLNESFATYFASLWTEHDAGWDEAAWQRMGESAAYLDEDKRVRRSIVNYRYNSPENMFDRHSYPKGARVLHMLRFELGDEMFWRALQRYVSLNQHRAVETADLRIAVEESTGVGMNWFFDQWVYRGGHPEFQVEWNWDEGTRTATVQVKQLQKVDDTTPLFRTSAEIEFASASSTTSRRVHIQKAEETFHFQLEARPDRVCFDPQDWILKTLKFDKSKQELLNQLSNDKHVMVRVQAVRGLDVFSQDEDVVAALRRVAKSDVFWGVRHEAVQLLAKKSTADVQATLLEVVRADSKSMVRRDAAKALGSFVHDDVKETLRSLITTDPSYYVVAESLRSLRKVDPEHCEPELLAALSVSSHNEVVLRAAVEGLVERKSMSGADQIAELLKQPQSPERRVACVSALAQLKPADSSYQELLRGLLDNQRRNVRRAAVDSLVELGSPASIGWLQERRSKEIMPSAVLAIDQAVERLRGKQQDVVQLRKELDELQKQNRMLEERLRKLELLKTSP